MLNGVLVGIILASLFTFYNNQVIPIKMGVNDPITPVIAAMIKANTARNYTRIISAFILLAAAGGLIGNLV
jgi:hypothetical protein